MGRQNYRLGRTHSAARTGRRGSPSGPRASVVFLGQSEDLAVVYDWACDHGFIPVDIPHPDLVCAVVDEDILDGMCTSLEAAIVQRVRDSGLPCLPPSHARSWLAARADRTVSTLPRVGVRW